MATAACVAGPVHVDLQGDAAKDLQQLLLRSTDCCFLIDDACLMADKASTSPHLAADAPLAAPLLGEKRAEARPELRVEHAVPWRFWRRYFAGVKSRREARAYRRTLESWRAAQEMVRARPQSRIACPDETNGGAMVLDFAPQSSIDTMMFCISACDLASPRTRTREDFTNFVFRATTPNEPFFVLLVVDAPTKTLEVVHEFCNASQVNHARCVFGFIDSNVSSGKQRITDVVSVLKVATLLNALFAEGFID